MEEGHEMCSVLTEPLAAVQRSLQRVRLGDGHRDGRQRDSHAEGGDKWLDSGFMLKAEKTCCVD